MVEKLSKAAMLRAAFPEGAPSEQEVRENLFRRTGVWAETPGRARKNYHSVAFASESIQRIPADTSHLRRPVAFKLPKPS